MEQPINQSVITLEESGCEKEDILKTSVKSQPLFDVYRQYLQTFLIDYKLKFQGFTVEFFTVLLIFFKI